jgi:3-oxoadipate enol-lactonase
MKKHGHGNWKEGIMSYCECGEISLYYEVDGEGPPLLLIAGLGGGTWSWCGQVPTFRGSYRTITFDNRGAGRSSMPEGPYRMEQFAEDAQSLLDHLGIERACVLGLSMGGMIAQELALLAPQRIEALFLGCTHGGGLSRVSPAPDALELLLNNAGLTQKAIIEKNVPIFFSEACRRQRPEVVAAYCAAQLAAPEQPEYAFHAQLAAISSFDTGERIAQIRVPTMIVCGSEDVLVPPENTETLGRRLPHAEVRVIPGAGHALHFECRDLLNSLADEFFKRCLERGFREENR